VLVRCIAVALLVAACSGPAAPTPPGPVVRGEPAAAVASACRVTPLADPPTILAAYGRELHAGVVDRGATTPRWTAPRRVHPLDGCLDCVISNVALVDWSGRLVELGPGWSPRRLPTGQAAWMVEDGQPAQLARREPDGAVRRVAPAAHAISLLGGFAPFRWAPFTPDGRYQLTAYDPADESQAGIGAIALYDDPDRQHPIARLAEVDGRARTRFVDLFVGDDASVIAGCALPPGTHPDAPRWRFSRLDRGTGLRSDRAVSGRCVAFGPRAEQALVVERAWTEDDLRFVRAVVQRHDRDTPLPLASRTDVQGAAFAPCGEAVFTIGPALEDAATVRIERFDVATARAELVLEAPLEHAWTDFALLVDTRGWLVAVATPAFDFVTARAWAIPLAGGAPRSLALHTDELHELVLGPDAI
jgi:hypothetical protein